MISVGRVESVRGFALSIQCEESSPCTISLACELVWVTNLFRKFEKVDDWKGLWNSRVVWFRSGPASGHDFGRTTVKP